MGVDGNNDYIYSAIFQNMSSRVSYSKRYKWYKIQEDRPKCIDQFVLGTLENYIFPQLKADGDTYLEYWWIQISRGHLRARICPSVLKCVTYSSKACWDGKLLSWVATWFQRRSNVYIVHVLGTLLLGCSTSRHLFNLLSMLCQLCVFACCRDELSRRCMSSFSMKFVILDIC